MVNSALSAVDQHSYAAALAQTEEDSDAWLTVDEEAVDVLMEERGGPSTSSGDAESAAMAVDAGDGSSRTADPEVEATADRLQQLARKVEKFVEGRGDMQGALFDEYVAMLFDGYPRHPLTIAPFDA